MKNLLSKVSMAAFVFLFAQSHADEVANKEKSNDYKPDLVRIQFIQYEYFVIGGNARKGELYRAKIKIFEENGKLLIRRTRNEKAETVDRVPRRDYPEGLPTWEAHFKNEKISVSYVFEFYHDNMPLLIGEVTHDEKAKGDDGAGVETAYPDNFVTQREQDGADQPAAAPESKSESQVNPKPEAKVAPR